MTDAGRDTGELLAEAWREACSHMELAEAVPRIARIARRVWPGLDLIIREIDAQRQVVHTAFSTLSGRGPDEPSPCPAATLKRLVIWAEAHECHTVRKLREEAPPLGRLIPNDIPGPALAGGVAGTRGGRAIALFVPSGSGAVLAAHSRLARQLLEPLGAALDNHRQLIELQGLRAAAEADKQSLLSRLGRDSMSETVVGAAGGLRGVFERINRVSKSDVPVLILGETGSGKEVIAREIHTRSKRADGPFIRVNCGAIPPELIDSELFGHEKGSFTGATSQRHGWFERAHQGTLFLDEVGELPLAAQVRLLRVLQDGLIQRVGGEQDLSVDVRIVAATHRDLPNLIQDGRFREDLWYRLATFPVVLPPLRERRGDIPALAAHFARRAAGRLGVRVQNPTEDDLILLASYGWPGNVREFAAVLDRAVILGDGERLEVAKALGAQPATSPAPQPRTSFGSPSHPPQSVRAEPLATLDQAMRAHIEAALAQTFGRIEGRHGAARLLAINPHTLRARMRKLGIDWASYKSGE